MTSEPQALAVSIHHNLKDKLAVKYWDLEKDILTSVCNTQYLDIHPRGGCGGEDGRKGGVSGLFMQTPINDLL